MPPALLAESSCPVQRPPGWPTEGQSWSVWSCPHEEQVRGPPSGLFLLGGANVTRKGSLSCPVRVSPGGRSSLPQRSMFLCTVAVELGVVGTAGSAGPLGRAGQECCGHCRAGGPPACWLLSEVQPCGFACSPPCPLALWHHCLPCPQAPLCCPPGLPKSVVDTRCPRWCQQDPQQHPCLLCIKWPCRGH